MSTKASYDTINEGHKPNNPSMILINTKSLLKSILVSVTFVIKTFLSSSSSNLSHWKSHSLLHESKDHSLNFKQCSNSIYLSHIRISNEFLSRTRVHFSALLIIQGSQQTSMQISQRFREMHNRIPISLCSLNYHYNSMAPSPTYVIPLFALPLFSIKKKINQEQRNLMHDYWF